MRTMMFLTILVLLTTKLNANSVTEWANKTWTETVEYQKSAWQNGKEQNAKNVETIKNLWNKIITGTINE